MKDNLLVRISYLFSRKTRKLFQDPGEPQKQQITTNIIPKKVYTSYRFVLFLRFTAMI